MSDGLANYATLGHARATAVTMDHVKMEPVFVIYNGVGLVVKCLYAKTSAVSKGSAQQKGAFVIRDSEEMTAVSGLWFMGR